MQNWAGIEENSPTELPHLCATLRSEDFRLQIATDFAGVAVYTRSRGSRVDEWSDWHQIAYKSDIGNVDLSGYVQKSNYIDQYGRIRLWWDDNGHGLQYSIDGSNQGCLLGLNDGLTQYGAMVQGIRFIAERCGMSSIFTIKTILRGETINLGDRTGTYVYHSSWDNLIGFTSWAQGQHNIGNYYRWGNHINGSGLNWTGISCGYDFVSLTNPNQLFGIIVCLPA